MTPEHVAENGILILQTSDTIMTSSTQRRKGGSEWTAALLLATWGCQSAPSRGEASSDLNASADTTSDPPQQATITSTVGSTLFVTREHFLAAGEMQISGEPFAQSMGRDLGGYSRDHIPPDLYFDPTLVDGGSVVDLPGFSTGVESYEYSKQPMNNVALESGAGTSLAYGPLVNPNGVGGAAATALLAARVQHFAAASHAL